MGREGLTVALTLENFPFIVEISIPRPPTKYWEQEGAYDLYDNWPEGFTQNQVQIAHHGLTYSDLLDGMELMCEAARREDGGLDSSCTATGAPPELTSVEDIPAVRRYLNCVASKIDVLGQRIILQDVPMAAVDRLAESGADQSRYPERGNRGRAISGLRALLEQIRPLPRSLANEIAGFASDLEFLESIARRYNIQRDIAELTLTSTAINQLGACVQGAISTFGLGAVVSCGGAAAQLAIAIQIDELESSARSDEERDAIREFSQRFRDRVESLNRISDSLGQQNELFLERLAELDSVRREARRALGKALFVNSDPMGNEFHVNTVMRRRYATTLARYQEARDAAVRLTYLAKRALEQRLGMRLSEMSEPMTLIDAPASWEGSLCQATGIDYSRIRDETPLPNGNYAGEFVGDYVRRLETVFESYRIDYPFSSGVDTAVFSLRDDIHNSRTECEVDVPNLLARSADLDMSLSPDGGATVWEFLDTACTPIDDGFGTLVIRNCVDVRRLTEADASTGPAVDSGSLPIRGHRVTFARGVAAGVGASSYTDGAEWYQAASLTPGRYRLSWYGANIGSVTGVTATDPSTAVGIVADVGGPGGLASSGVFDTSSVEVLAAGWTRYFQFVDVPEEQDVRVRAAPELLSPSNEQAVDLAGFMLEDVTGRVVDPMSSLGTGSTIVTGDIDHYRPSSYLPTTNAGRADLMLCEDVPIRDGSLSKFLRTNWAYDCVRLCQDGFAGSCSPETATPYCYWETEFDIGQSRLEHSLQGASAGFAYGNFNYRTDRIGVNFVGSASRSCADERLPSTCYSSGYIPYSIEHQGPYTVRNHLGESYEAPLFTGRIEHARGLAAERYITNPISSADHTLLDPYMRRELRGRPMDGRYVLRVWDGPGVNFEGIEDVQIVWQYRYLTRGD